MGKAMKPGKKLKVVSLEYIEVFYNRKRRHSYLGLESPRFFEDKYMVKSYENAA